MGLYILSAAKMQVNDFIVSGNIRHTKNGAIFGATLYAINYYHVPHFHFPLPRLKPPTYCCSCENSQTDINFSNMVMYRPRSENLFLHHNKQSKTLQLSQQCASQLLPRPDINTALHPPTEPQWRNVSNDLFGNFVTISIKNAPDRFGWALFLP